MRRATALLLTVLLGVLGLIAVPSADAAATWAPRAEDYPKTVTRTDLPITMDDGTVLRADLTLPADADGTAITTKVPVVVTITAYNKSAASVPGVGNVLTGADPTYLVKRGYAQLTVDARGTGSSEGTWCAFCSRETQDYGEIMTWAHDQSWSNGSTAMTGPAQHTSRQLAVHARASTLASPRPARPAFSWAWTASAPRVAHDPLGMPGSRRLVQTNR